MRKRIEALCWLVGAFLLAACLYGALQSKAYVDGESGGVVSSSINFARGGALSHVMWGEHYASAGIRAHTVHPPFFYLLGGLWFKVVGISMETIFGFPVLLAIIGMSLASLMVWRIFGLTAAVVTFVLAASLEDFYIGVASFRPEILVGVLNLAAFTLVMLINLGKVRERLAVWAVFTTGVVVAANYATHGFSAFGVPVLAAGLLGPAIKQRQVLAFAGSGLAGVALALLFWNWLFDGELYQFLYLHAAMAKSFKHIGHGLWQTLLQPAVTGPGGLAVAVGFLLSHVVGFANLIAVDLQARGTQSKWRKLVALCATCMSREEMRILMWAIAFSDSYLLVMGLAAGNLGNPYLANLYCMLVPVAAIGMVKAIEIACKLAGRRRSIERSIYALLILALVLQPGPLKSYAVASVAGNSSNALYANVREQLARILPKTGVLLMGSSVYPYLYDRPFVSTMDLIWHDEIDHTYKPPFDEAVERTVANYWRYHKAIQTSFPPERFGSIAMRKADYMVIGDSCHWWQCKFGDTGAWNGKFVPVGTVVIISTRLGGRPEPNRDADTELFRAFVRADRIDALLPGFDTSKPSATRSGSVGVLYPGGGARRFHYDRFTREEWRAQPLSERRQRLIVYLEAVDYFGLQESKREAFVTAAHPEVELSYLEIDRSQAFNVGQALEYAMTNEKLWRFFD